MASFDLSRDRFAVTGDLDSSAEGQPRVALWKLLDADSEVVTIDPSEVNMITSVCVGALAVPWIDLASAGRRGKLVASSAARKVPDMSGLTAVLAGEGGLAAMTWLGPLTGQQTRRTCHG
jgi:hypothetical protein